ncbi:MAG TPA: hypothetical protein VMH87_02815 [Pseudomonadales bacterium]|nr:hypothetical protein [Pseudomonadales bacterium]
MKTTFRSTTQTSRGYALLVTLVFMGIMLVLFGMMMTYTLTNAKITKRNNQYNSSQAAAEAAAEKVLAQMTHDFEFQSLSNNGSYYATTYKPSSSDMSSWPAQYNFSSPTNSTAMSVYMGPWSSNSVPLNSQYAGLQGFEEDCVITATATPASGVAVPATVVESLQFAEIPLFQFAIFYNMNLEIAAAQTLNIAGPVYSNGGIWSGSTSITFASTVSAVGLATNSSSDPFCSGYTGSGLSTYSKSGQPTSGNDTLTMPVGSNNIPSTVEAIVNIPPSSYALGTAAMFSTNGQLYLANKADLYLTNTPIGTNWNAIPTGTNLFLYYQDGANGTNYQMWVTNDFYALKVGGVQGWTNSVQTATSAGIDCVTNVRYAGYTFLTNVLFWDWREGWHNGSGPPKSVQAVQLDLVKFNTWLMNKAMNGGSNYNYLCYLSNHKSRSIDSIYVYNAVPLTSTVLPAVRIINGAMMPPATGSRGFTLATAQPLYVQGDYNVQTPAGSSIDSASVQYTQPAGLMADSITVLSDNWSDANSSSSHASTDTSGGPTATTTEINAACLEGIVQSTNNAASNAHGYSGGVENFLRLLENWSSANLWYNGSIVVMFPSQFATNCWQQTGNYYTAPTRKWAFDTNFNNYLNLPPLTPTSQGVLRATWVAN